MTRADYTYTIENGLVKIIDLNLGKMSVTNDAEAVLTEINHSLENIEDKRVVYRDTFGEWDEIVPVWENGTCVNVNFKTLKGEL